MSKYINIHTHLLNDEDCISIFNHRFHFDKEIISTNYFSIGVHPYDCNLVTDKTFSQIQDTLKHPNCKAIGECGLDKVISIPIEIQKQVFINQLKLAEHFHKPVIIHCVKAYQELIEVTKPFQNKIPLIIHGFYKSNELASQLISNGFYLSVNPKLVSSNSFNLSALPLNKLFFETDDNSEIPIQSIYKMAADKLKLSETELKEKIYLNFAQLFL